MDVVSCCPLPVASLVWRPPAGGYAITVVVKATFTLAPGESPLAEEQEDAFEADVHWDDDARRSLAAATDLVPYKRRAEVLVVGHAHAPGGIPVVSLLVRLAVGEVEKSILVVGDRHFTLDGQLTDPARFTRMPLRWERAAGGPDTGNPVGVRADARPDTRGRTPCPNLFPPHVHLVDRGTFIPPVGLGPVTPTWPGVEPGRFNAAPPDQQLDELRADATIILENLHPEHPRLVTRLAPIAPVATVTLADGSAATLPLQVDTLWIDADRGLASLTFRAAMALAHPDQPGRIAVTLSEPTWDAEETISREGPPFEQGSAPPRPGLGMVLGMGALGRNSAAAESEPPESQPLSERTFAGLIEAPSRPLPFDDPPTCDDDGGPGAAGLPFTAPVLPFAPAPAPIVDRPTASWIPPALPFFPASPPPIATPSPPPPPAAIEAAPPAMVGPLATPEMFAAAASPEPPPEQAPPEQAPQDPAPPEPPPLPLDDFPLARCAAIAAAIAHRPPDRARTLERHDLPADLWTRLHDHWTAALRTESERGKQALLSVYDAAYVAELERLRGSITVEEHARLLVASERGQSDRALAELDLPRSALLRVKRVWLRRCAEDVALGAALRGAVEDARDAD